MRVIKFRAWDFDKNKMFCGYELDKPINEESSYEILGLATTLYIIGNIFENQNLLE